jgi:hypothetical protein
MDFFRDVVMTAATQGGGAAPGPSEGPELIDNGDMSNDTGWTFENPGGLGTAEISTGKLRLSDPEGNGVTATRAVTLTNSATYRIRFTVDTIVAGSCTVIVGETGIEPSITTTGAKQFDVVAGTEDTVQFNPSAGSAEGLVIDDLSLKLLS